jgi:hypothetical protein
MPPQQKTLMDVLYIDSYYAGIEPGSIPATTNTAYKWSFAAKKTRTDDDALRAAREEVSAATYGHGAGPSSSSSSNAARASGSGRIQGPAMPSAADLTLARELTQEQRDAERALKRKRDKLEARDRIEEMVGPKPLGREAMLEKKRAKREGDRTFRERGDDGLELDESTLMGGGDSFREQCVHVLCIIMPLYFYILTAIPNYARYFQTGAKRDEQVTLQSKDRRETKRHA